MVPYSTKHSENNNNNKKLPTLKIVNNVVSEDSTAQF